MSDNRPNAARESSEVDLDRTASSWTASPPARRTVLAANSVPILRPGDTSAVELLRSVHEIGHERFEPRPTAPRPRDWPRHGVPARRDPRGPWVYRPLRFDPSRATPAAQFAPGGSTLHPEVQEIVDTSCVEHARCLGRHSVRDSHAMVTKRVQDLNERRVAAGQRPHAAPSYETVRRRIRRTENALIAWFARHGDGSVAEAIARIDHFDFGGRHVPSDAVPRERRKSLATVERDDMDEKMHPEVLAIVTRAAYEHSRHGLPTTIRQAAENIRREVAHLNWSRAHLGLSPLSYPSHETVRSHVRWLAISSEVDPARCRRSRSDHVDCEPNS